MQVANVTSFSIKHSLTIGFILKHTKNGRPNKIQKNERIWQKTFVFLYSCCARRVLLGFGSKVMATQQEKKKKVIIQSHFQWTSSSVAVAALGSFVPMVCLDIS